MNNNQQSILNIAETIFQNIGFLHWIDKIQRLYNEQIYFDICKIIFPATAIKLFKISQSNLTTGQKIQQLINLLSNEIQMDLSHIEGQAIAKGDINHLYHLLQLFQEFSNYYLIKNEQKESNQVKSAPENIELQDQQDQNYHTVLAIDKQFANLQQGSEQQQHSDESQKQQDQQKQLLQYKKQSNKKKQQEFQVQPLVYINEAKHHKKLSSKHNMKKDESDEQVQILQEKGFPQNEKQKSKQRKQKRKMNKIQGKQIKDLKNKDVLQENKYKNYLKEFMKDKNVVKNKLSKKKKCILVNPQKKQREKLEFQKKAMKLQIKDTKIKYLNQINKIVIQLEQLKVRDQKKAEKHLKQQIFKNTQLKINSIKSDHKRIKSIIDESSKKMEQNLEYYNNNNNNNNKKLVKKIEKQFKKGYQQEKQIQKNKMQKQNDKLMNILKDSGSLQKLIISMYKVK